MRNMAISRTVNECAGIYTRLAYAQALEFARIGLRPQNGALSGGT